MGYDRTLFPNPVKQELICKICNKVLYQPCAINCGHYFCSSCVKGKLKPKICPVCTKVLDTETEQQVEIPSWILVQLDALQMNCPQLCGAVLSVKFISDHIDVKCQNSPAECPNTVRGCTEAVTRGTLLQHETECLFREVACSACNLQVVYFDLYKHQMRKKCFETAMKLDRARCLRRCNTDIKVHNARMKEDANRTAQHGRRITLQHWAARGISAFQKYAPQTENNSELKRQRETSSLAQCARCYKPFIEKKNHATACQWHAGPLVETFGGMCVACGKLINKQGCLHARHVTIEELKYIMTKEEDHCITDEHISSTEMENG